jgi:Calpain family cysteine protease/Bacterial pre-peptidase C-terminal domain
MADLAGNTLTSAQNLGSGNQSVTGWVGMTDLSDFYKISVTQSSGITIDLSTPNRSAELQLICDRNNNGAIEAGERLASSTASRLFADQITTTLEKGDYYICVSSDSLLGASYGLNVTTRATAATLDAGADLATARSVTLGSGILNIQDALGTQDVNDFYKFTLTQINQLQIRLDGLSANADLQLLDGKGVELAKSTAAGLTAEFLSRSLTAGTYGIRVFGAEATTYSLNIASAAAPAQAQLFAAPIGNLAPDTVNFDFALASVMTTETLTINGLATDRNGGSDIAKVDLKLRRTDGTILDIADATTFTVTNDQARFSTTINIKGLNLTAGNYSLLAQAVDKTGSLTSGTIERAFTLRPDPVASSWAAQNIKDVQLQTSVYNRFLDGKIDRADMIAILREAATDDAKVDATEFADLQKIIAAGTLNLDDSVRVLANKVVNGDVANANFTGGGTAIALGNLDVTKAAQSSQAHLGKLIDKWFLGLDRPTLLSGDSYQKISGSLFQNGIGIDDIKQQSLGDCYFLVSLASAALESPSIIQNMFTDNGDGTYVVRFFDRDPWGVITADYVTVDTYLPTRNNNSIYASWGSNAANSGNELWVALAEKAYAQWNESGKINQDETNRYIGIEGGDPEVVMDEITGVGTTWKNSTAFTKQEAIDLFNSKKLVTISIYDNTNGVSVPVTNHAYVGKSYNATTGLFSFHNPWGTKHFEVTWDQLVTLAAPINYTRA